MLTDEDAALQAIAALEKPSPEQQEALKAVDTIIHNGEPFVDVHELFAHYNATNPVSILKCHPNTC
jgi:hypothetical protein